VQQETHSHEGDLHHAAGTAKLLRAVDVHSMQHTFYKALPKLPHCEYGKPCAKYLPGPTAVQVTSGKELSMQNTPNGSDDDATAELGD
jgi:hypothetical protein